MIVVLGSGFGLYGHLPALVELGQDVALPARYRPAFEARAELAAYAGSVRFAEDESGLLGASETAVLARRPADNRALAYQVLKNGGPRLLVIEKPLAPTPAAARDLAAALTHGRIRHVVPYLLVHCDWAHTVRQALLSGQGKAVRLKWQFHSPTVAAGSWKASESAGGGPFNYYFIHVIALAVFLLGEDLELGESWQRSSDAGFEVGMNARSGDLSFTATFRADPAESACTVLMDDNLVLSSDTPFGAVPRRGERDPRIDTLKRFYTDAVFGPQDSAVTRQELGILDLWDRMSEARK